MFPSELLLGERLLEGGVPLALGLGHGLVGELSAVGVHALRQVRVFLGRPLDALVGELEAVAEGRVREREGRGPGHGSRHVGDAVVDDPVDLVDRVGVRRGLRRLEAAALVHRHVDRDGPLLHLGDQLSRHELGRRGAGDQDRPDQEIRPPAALLERDRVRSDRLHAAEEDVVEVAHAIRRHLEDRHVGAHAGGDLGRVRADDSPADDHDVGRRDPGHAREQHAPAAVGLLQVVRPDVDAHPPRDLGHRRQKRQGSVRGRDGLVGDARDLPLEEHVGQRLRRREVQVRVEDLSFAQTLVLGADGLLDLDDHVGLGEDLIGRAEDLRSRPGVLLVGNPRARAGVVLDVHGVAGGSQRFHARRHHADAVFVVLDLPGKPDDHARLRLGRHNGRPYDVGGGTPPTPHT